MSVHEGTHAPHQASRVPWLNSSDAPKKPDAATHRTKLNELLAQRRALITEVKELQNSLHKDLSRPAYDQARKACRERLSEIDAERHGLRERRAAQDAEIAKLRKKRADIAERLRDVQAEVGVFKSVQEIDEAREYVMCRMESSGGGLQAERRNQALLSKLEHAKSHLAQLQPLTEAMREVADQETVLQQDYLAISEQIGIHNKEYDEEMQKKRALDKEAQNNSARLSKIFNERSSIRQRISDISQSIECMCAEFEKRKSMYNAWLKETREQRRKEYEEHIKAQKVAAKKAYAVQRQNPYMMEISACTTLIEYLKQKKIMMLQDEEERKKREEASHFDATQVAPAGCIVLNEGKWADNKPLSKAAKKHQKQQQKQKEKMSAAKHNDGAAAAEQPTVERKDRMLHYPEDKIRLFQMIEVEPALSLASIDNKIRQIEERKSKYEEHIQTGDLALLSSDSDEEDCTES